MLSCHLDTAPVIEAVKLNLECPLCELEAASERDYVQNFLGGSVMEPAVRVEVNEKGFCGEHFSMLFQANNRLSLALMADTHLRRVIETLEAQPPRAGKRFPLGRRGTAPQSPAQKLTQTCVLCDRLRAAMARYLQTLLHLYRKEPSFREALLHSKGFCLRHYAALTDAAPGAMNAAELANFLAEMRALEIQNLQRIEKELDWFTQKFDYRNRDKPFGESRDAVERALRKLRKI